MRGRKKRLQAFSRVVVADDAHQSGGSAEFGNVERYVGSAPQAVFVFDDAHYRYRGFRRNAVGVAEPITVEHRIADDEKPFPGECGLTDHRELQGR